VVYTDTRNVNTSACISVTILADAVVAAAVLSGTD
jgi:hypothetical protein